MSAKLDEDQQELSRTRKPEAVGEMFTCIAPRYDLMNRVMTFGFDSLWRARMAKAACANLPQSGARVIDIACGSGESVFALRRNMAARRLKDAEITGVDFSDGMLALARQKSARDAVNRCGIVENFAKADCAALPFPDNTFNAATIAFGFRNFSDRKKCLLELCRVLKEGGKICILEVSRAPGILSAVQDFLMEYPIPAIAGIFGCDKKSYKYLAETTRNFPVNSELCRLIESAGFSGAISRPMAFGAVALTCAVKEKHR